MTAHSETDTNANPAVAINDPFVTHRRKANVRVREMQEWNGVLVYTPDNPSVFYLNSTCWMILELTESMRVDQARHAFSELVADWLTPSDANSAFDEGLCVLEERGVIERVVDDTNESV